MIEGVPTKEKTQNVEGGKISLSVQKKKEKWRLKFYILGCVKLPELYMWTQSMWVSPSLHELPYETHKIFNIMDIRPMNFLSYSCTWRTILAP